MHHLTASGYGITFPKHYRSTRSLNSQRSVRSYENTETHYLKSGRLKDKVTINVCGEIFETFGSTLNKYPETLLGTNEKRNLLCNTQTNQIYFNRHRVAFEAILYYYQSSGNLIRPTCIPMKQFVNECIFYEMPDKAIKTMKERECYLHQPKREYPKNKFKKSSWLFIDFPTDYGNYLAIFYCIVSLILIMVSIATFCVESELYLWFDDEMLQDYVQICQYVELTTNLYFLIELIFRGYIYPSKILFLKETSNLAECASFLLFIICYCLPAQSTIRWYGFCISRILRGLRLARASRISKPLNVSKNVFIRSINDVIAVVFVILILCIFSGSAMYYIEMDEKNTKFLSIPDSMWWSMQSLLCLGYGDIVPETALGKSIGSVVIFLGVVTVTVLLLSLGGRIFDMYSKEFYKISFLPSEAEKRIDYEIHY